MVGTETAIGVMAVVVLFFLYKIVKANKNKGSKRDFPTTPPDNPKEPNIYDKR